MTTKRFSKVKFGTGFTVTDEGGGVITLGGAGGATGPEGPTGPTGATGATGPAGPGVPTGGTTGQALEKASGTDYDTHWVTLTGGTVAHLDDIGDVTAPTPADEDVIYWDAGASVWKSRQAVLKNVATAKGDLIAAPSANNFSRLAVGSNGQVLTADSTQTTGIKWAAVPGGGYVAVDTIWDAKGDLAVATGADAAAKLAVGSNGQVLTADSTQTTGVKWAAAAGGAAITKLFDSTITGSDVTSIDTGAGGIAGGYTMIEAVLYGRCDNSNSLGEFWWQFNNDAAGNYDWQRHAATGSTGGVASIQNNDTGLDSYVTGGTATANTFGISRILIPNYDNTVGFKVATWQDGYAGPSTLGRVSNRAGIWRSTSAITRVAVVPLTGGAKFKVGSRMTIYGYS